MMKPGIDNPVAADNMPSGVTVFPHVAGWDAQPLDLRRFDVPSWARWVAANENGCVWAYKQKPVRNKIYNWWLMPDETFEYVLYLGTIDMAGIDWTKTLTPVNQDTEPTTVSIPSDVAAQLWSLHSDEWCIRLIDELLALMEAAKDAERHERIAAAILAGAGALE